ncbi:MAG: single-stranded-DNA-specific exonuclease RecJ [Verrucomicrobiota bacterium]|nr:single-stranded-DNA-specific exonuclease RecJ [Verrucomicrobiota bacterium]
MPSDRHPNAKAGRLSASTRWVTAEADEDRARAVANALGIPQPAARALAVRGIQTPTEAAKYLEPRLSNLSDPFLLPAMEPAVDRVWKAIRGKEKILIFGDYDADGVTGTVLLVQLLRGLGGRPAYFTPNRLTDGYGLTTEPLKRCLVKERPGLLITVDCGTDAREAFEMARVAECDVVVTDHHEPASEPSDAAWVVNPKRGKRKATDMLAGVGVAFKLGHAIVKRGLDQSWDACRSVDMRDWLDLVAVGTVADVAPLLGENRILVTHGLSWIGRSSSEGLRALMRVGRVDGDVTPYHLAFVLGPRLNAAGRFGQAEVALNLLLATDRLDAERLALELDRANERRKRIEERIMREAATMIDASFDPGRDFGVVAGRTGWHTGIIGIVAARLNGLYRRPAVVIGFDRDGKGRGSCRCAEGMDILEVLRDCAGLLASFGGHRAAAGLVVEQRNYEAFKQRFQDACAARTRTEDLRHVERIDAWLDSLGAADERLLDTARKFAPLGHGNPAPLWGLRRVEAVGAPRVVGGQHLRMTLGANGILKDAIGFGLAGRPCPPGPLDVVFHLQEDSFGGRKRVQLKLKNFRPAAPAE